MKPQRSLGARVALTVLPVIALVFARAHLLVPGLGDDAIVRKLHDESPFETAANLSVFALGVMAFVEAYFIVELLAMAVPRWRRLRHGNPEGRAKLERAARAFGLVLVAFQAFGLAQSLSALSSSSLAGDLSTPGLGPISVPIVTATLVGGACIALLVADLVTRQGIVNGLLLLPVIDLVLVMVDDARSAHARAAITGLWEPRHTLIAVGVSALVLFAGWAAVRGTHDVRAVDPGREPTAYRDARSLVVRPIVPVPSSTIAPATIAASILMLPATLANLKLPTQGIANVLERGDATFTILYVGLIAALAVGLTRILHRPGEAEDLARRLGTSIDRASVVAAQNRALVPTLLFFAIVLVAGRASTHLPARSVALTSVHGAVIAALALDVVRALRLPAGLVAVWQERRAVAVPVVRAVLEAQGIETHVSGAATHALLQAFAPYAPVTVHVATAHAERATKILRHLLLGEEAPARETDERGPPRAAPAWSPKKRLVAFAAALLAGCALIGIGSMKRAAPPGDGRPPPKLELVAVADEEDVVAQVPDAQVPEGIEIRYENVPAGTDAYGGRQTTRMHYVSVPLRDGETIEGAIARGEALAKQILLAPRRRLAWEPTSEFDPETNKETISGVRSYVVEDESWISNRDVVAAEPSVSTTNAAPDVYIAIELTPEAGERFRKLTAARVNRRIAILLDGRVNSAPVVRQEIGGGRMSLTMGAGDYEQKVKEAQALARALSSR